jgi:hypothetical protein
MCGIDRNRAQQRIDLACVKQVHGVALFPLQLRHGQDAYILAAQRRQQFLVPAVVLVGDKGANAAGQRLQQGLRGKTVRAGLLGTVLHLLQQSRQPNFYKFVQIAGGDG